MIQCLEVKGDSHKLIKLRSSKSELLLQRCYQATASARNCPSNLCTSSHPDKTVSRPTPGTTDGVPAEEVLWIRAHTHTLTGTELIILRMITVMWV